MGLATTSPLMTGLPFCSRRTRAMQVSSLTRMTSTVALPRVLAGFVHLDAGAGGVDGEGEAEDDLRRGRCSG